MKKTQANGAQVHELLYQALETELGGVKVYETAVRCAVNEDLKNEWNEYLEQTRHHVQVLLDVFAKIGLDPEVQTPGRKVVARGARSSSARTTPIPRARPAVAGIP